MPKDPDPALTQNMNAVAVEFATALTERDYGKAYSMTTEDYRARTSQQDLIRQFEVSCPLDYGDFDTPEVLNTMDAWPAKRPGELRWIYVTIGGESNEAVSVVVAREHAVLKISSVEVGRP